MIVIFKARYKESQIKEVVESLKQYNVTCDVSRGSDITIIGLVSDTSAVDREKIMTNPHVERLWRYQSP